MTALHAVFGQPIAHSRSPRIHAAFGEALQMAVDYRAIEAGPEQFSQTLSAFFAAGGRGANVTLPLKELAFDLVQARSSRAARAGAVNTLVWRDGGWFGDNTDGIGLVRDLTVRHGVQLSGTRVVMLGAGGAARGVAPALLDAGVADLVIVNRTVARAQALCVQLQAGERVQALGWEALPDLTPADVVIQATAAGRGEAVLPPVPPALLGVARAVVDLNYGVAAEAFLHMARQAGAARVIDGLGMLVEQAAEAFALWHGVRPATDTLYAQLRAEDGMTAVLEKSHD